MVIFVVIMVIVVIIMVIFVVIMVIVVIIMVFMIAVFITVLVECKGFDSISCNNQGTIKCGCLGQTL